MIASADNERREFLSGSTDLSDDGVNHIYVGELISTGIIPDKQRLARMCQSPSHRGTHFNFGTKNC